jgi:hypothetical protein
MSDPYDLRPQTDAEKLRLVADWFDIVTVQHPEWTGKDVQRDLRRIADELEGRGGHCRDCCCAKAWEALEITDYTGLSIPEEIKRLMTALRKVKENVENEGWCPICDEHTCREGYCILAGLKP